MQLSTSASSNGTIDSLASQIASQCIVGSHLGLNTTTGWSNNPSNGYFGAKYLFRARKYLGLAATKSKCAKSHGASQTILNHMVYLTWIPYLSMCLLVCLSPASVCLPACARQGVRVCHSIDICKQVTAGLCGSNQFDSSLDVSNSMFMQRVPFLA